MQDQTHHGNVESTSSCVQGSASSDRQGHRGPLGGVPGGTRDTPPTPRHEGLYKHLKMTVALGGRKTGGHQAIKDENGNLL